MVPARAAPRRRRSRGSLGPGRSARSLRHSNGAALHAGPRPARRPAPRRTAPRRALCRPLRHPHPHRPPAGGAAAAGHGALRSIMAPNLFPSWLAPPPVAWPHAQPRAPTEKPRRRKSAGKGSWVSRRRRLRLVLLSGAAQCRESFLVRSVPRVFIRNQEPHSALSLLCPQATSDTGRLRACDATAGREIHADCRL